MPTETRCYKCQTTEEAAFAPSQRKRRGAWLCHSCRRTRDTARRRADGVPAWGSAPFHEKLSAGASRREALRPTEERRIQAKRASDAWHVEPPQTFRTRRRMTATWLPIEGPSHAH